MRESPVAIAVLAIGLVAASSLCGDETVDAPQADLAGFREQVEPVLRAACLDCHGPDLTEGSVRIDTLDPDLVAGGDVEWWLDVRAVLAKGEMPPAEAEPLADDARQRVVDWLSAQLQLASQVRRAEHADSSQRRMTRYEYRYALQDLLGLPYDFARDLPPEAASSEGFENGADTLRLTVSQFMAYREAGRRALELASVRGEKPQPLFWQVTMQAASAAVWPAQEAALEAIRSQHADDPQAMQVALDAKVAELQAAHGGPYYKRLDTGRTAAVTWEYPEARYAWSPTTEPQPAPADRLHVAVLPPRQRLTVELGDRIPERGTLQVRVLASRPADVAGPPPSLAVEFGWQASNDSHASVKVSHADVEVTASADAPQTLHWEIPLPEVLPRNLVRGVSKMGDLPSPSEFLRLVNSTVARGSPQADVQIHAVEVTADLEETWPPASHTRLFLGHDLAAVAREDEPAVAREILADFMPRAWRQPVRDGGNVGDGEPVMDGEPMMNDEPMMKDEIERKLALLARLRPEARDFQEALLEVMAAVLASPRFLYLEGPPPRVAAADASGPPFPEGQRQPAGQRLSDADLATRLSIFLWCSLPDATLRARAAAGDLAADGALAAEARRLLADQRSHRFCEQFTRQWLGLEKLDYLSFERGQPYGPPLKEAMQREPIALFEEMLRSDASVLEFIAADYAIVNERLARHYGLEGVHGNAFRRVSLAGRTDRGGLLTQAGLLAMNSDGVDSHPLKRGVWLLERLLDDPPPPPPPAVPVIDLADPEIAKLSLKERLADHRNQAACRSCHERIDPWGIALENYDAVGSWRSEIDGRPVDAASTLFNGETLDGIQGLRAVLLGQRREQFRRAMVRKLATFALGRPLGFADHAQIDAITARLDAEGDGLATMVLCLVESDLFRSR